jgi:hypothetical protein
MVAFNDFTQQELKQIIRDYNLHLVIKKYSMLNKEALIKLIESHLFINNKNEIKVLESIITKSGDLFKDIKPGFIRAKKVKKEIPEPKETPEPPPEPKEINNYDTDRFTKVNNNLIPNFVIKDSIKRLSRNELGETYNEKIKKQKDLSDQLKSIVDVNFKNKMIKEINDYNILEEKDNLLPELKKTIEEFIKPKTKIINSKDLDKLLGNKRL